jgi:hypothetical protein
VSRGSARRLGLAVLLVAAGRLLSPDAVPVYDGIGQPDEPYRFVAPPADAPKTAPPTVARASSPVKDGRSAYGMSAASAEVGPQFSLFVPPQSLATKARTVSVRVEPRAPSDQPPGARIDGNVYQVSLLADAPVQLTDKAALATLYLRATTAKQPPPKMEFRSSQGEPWKTIRTVRGGQDVYVSSFEGPGFYALAFTSGGSGKGGGSSPLPWVVLGGVVLATAVVVVVRLRSAT